MSAWTVVAIVRGPTRFAETIHVDAGTYIEALQLIADAWDVASYVRFRAVLSYVANMEPKPLSLRAWVAGRVAWDAASPATNRSTDLTAGRKRLRLRNTHHASLTARTARTISTASDVGA